MKRFHSLSYMERRARKGYLFMLPLFFGLALVFIPSLVRTVIFSFNEITIGSDTPGNHFFARCSLPCHNTHPFFRNNQVGTFLCQLLHIS